MTPALATPPRKAVAGLAMLFGAAVLWIPTHYFTGEYVTEFRPTPVPLWLWLMYALKALAYVSVATGPFLLVAAVWQWRNRRV